MTWAHIRVLYLLFIVPLLVIAFALDGQRRRRLLERIGHLPMIARMTASFSPGRRRWRAVLQVTAVGLLILALARPQMPGRAKLTESRGLDIVVALDLSKSMLARDVYPTRLDRAKAELTRFFDNLHGDRVGVVLFAGEHLDYPLTVDYEAVKLWLRDRDPSDIAYGGTDIGLALRESTRLLEAVREREGKKRPAQVIVLLTDGEDTVGKGLAAARRAAGLGIKIYTIGIGKNEQTPVPLFDEDGKQHGYVMNNEGDPVRVGLDEHGLKQIAAVAGGEYTPLDPRRFGVERVQRAIAGLERTEEEARFEREPDDVGRWFLVPGFLALLTAALVRERRFRRKPARAAAEPGAPPQRTATATLASAAMTEPTMRPSGEISVRSIPPVLILFLALPLLTGFDILKRKDPNIEEGNRLLNAGKAEDALKAYDRAVEQQPEEPIVHFDRGVALYKLGRMPEAQKEFMRAAEGHDTALKADAYYNMGNAQLKQGHFKEAFEAYKHTLGLRPEDRRAKWNLELALQQMKLQKQQQQQQQQQQKPEQQQQQAQQEQQQGKPDDKQQQPQQAQAEQQKQDEQKQQQEQQQKQEQPKPDAQKQQEQQQQAQADKERERLAQRQKKEQPRDIDKQDAEAVLDALERVEPTVQKDLARRRAAQRPQPAKDW